LFKYGNSTQHFQTDFCPEIFKYKYKNKGQFHSSICNRELISASIEMKVFRRTAGDSLNVHRRNEEILEEVKVEPVDDKLRR